MRDCFKGGEKKTGKFRIQFENPKEIEVEKIGAQVKQALDKAINPATIIHPRAQSPTVIDVDVLSALATDITVAQALRGKLSDGVKVTRVEE
jgi:hypothetical protein